MKRSSKEDPDSIWKYSSDVACSLLSNKNNKKKRETFVLYVGDKGAGKSSLINQFLGNNTVDDAVKPTIGLDYHYATRKTSNKSSSGDAVDDESKEMVHIWELGGGIINVGLIAASLRHHINQAIVIVIVLDLSLPCNVLPALSKWLSIVKKVLLQIYEENGNKDREKVNMELSNKNGKVPCNIDIFPVPLMIVANKYDLFKSQDSTSKRKRLIQALRIIAHIHHANLVLGSIKDKNAKEKYRTLSRQVLFSKKSQPAPKLKKMDQQLQKSKIIASHEPFYIKAGDDSLEQIFSSLPCGFTDVDMTMVLHQSSSANMDKMIAIFESLFGKYVDTNHEEHEIDRNKFEYPEKTIDKAKAAAYLRLQYYLKEKELK